MLIQRSLLCTALTILAALFLGLLACGPAAPHHEEKSQRPTLAAAPSQEEQRRPLAAGPAGQEQEETETPEPKETETPTSIPTPTPEPTSTPTPTPPPTICLDYQDRAGTLTQICRTKPDNTPGEYYKLASQTLQELAEEYDTEQSTDGDSGSRGTRGTEGTSSAATGPLVDVIIEVHTEDDLAPVVALLKSANWPPSYTWDTAVEARIPASLLPRLAKMEGVFSVNEVVPPSYGG